MKNSTYFCTTTIGSGTAPNSRISIWKCTKIHGRSWRITGIEIQKWIDCLPNRSIASLITKSQLETYMYLIAYTFWPLLKVTVSNTKQWPIHGVIVETLHWSSTQVLQWHTSQLSVLHFVSPKLKGVEEIHPRKQSLGKDLRIKYPEPESAIKKPKQKLAK